MEIRRACRSPGGAETRKTILSLALVSTGARNVHGNGAPPLTLGPGSTHIRLRPRGPPPPLRRGKGRIRSRRCEDRSASAEGSPLILARDREIGAGSGTLRQESVCVREGPLPRPLPRSRGGGENSIPLRRASREPLASFAEPRGPADASPLSRAVCGRGAGGEGRPRQRRLSPACREGREPKPASLSPIHRPTPECDGDYAIILRTSSVMRGRIWCRSPTIP
jgi:hypothetical protein